MTEDKLARRPIIDPLILALKSRRVLVALAALLIGIITVLIPEIEAVRGELLTLLITLALAIIGGYSLEDAARAGRERAEHPLEELRELVKRVLGEALDEIASDKSE